PLGKGASAAVIAAAFALALAAVLDPPFPRAIALLADDLLMWGSAAYVLGYSALNLRRLASGPFASTLLAVFASSLAFAALTALSRLGLFPALANYFYPAYFLAVSAIVIRMATSFFLGPSEVPLGPERGSGAGSRTVPTLFAQTYGLSPREVEVISFIMTGASSREIGQALFISTKTVDTHLAHVYQKTGAAGRFRLLALIRRF
ncbi:MAG: helix-turn-helix transcriptional regulator, partial [Spirochaetaceae bacterium]|nr:helix-turn-helix transcriptional regulator [Spirochaetaceae bacterium]